MVDQTVASAAENFEFRDSRGVHDDLLVSIYHNGTYAGYVSWNGDPWDDRPGDALRASDQLADGWGIGGELSTGRVASTVGHDSPYTTPWVTGDLPEDHSYSLTVYVKKGTSYIEAPFTLGVSS